MYIIGQEDSICAYPLFAIKSQAVFIEINSKCYLVGNSYRLPTEKGDNVQLMFIYILSGQHTTHFVWQNMRNKHVDPLVNQQRVQ